MIKANAYGHGDIAVAKALVSEGCDFLGVACVEEGVRLRQQHVTCNILVFGFYGPDAVAEILAQELTPVVSNFSQLEELARQAREPIKIHIKFNTGMNRLGFTSDQVKSLFDRIQASGKIIVEGVGSHLHSGETISEEGSSAEQQLRDFQGILSSWTTKVPYRHLYNSAATARIFKSGGPFSFGIRPGLLAYGIDPLENISLKPLIGPVMEFRSKIVSTQIVKSGEVVSYGGIWRASKDSLIGIVPAGYADGVNRGLSNKGDVLILGQRAPICGRVCMDYTMVDLSNLHNAPSSLVDQDVVFIGAQGDQEIGVEETARVCECSTYEIVTGISERVPRFYGAL